MKKKTTIIIVISIVILFAINSYVTKNILTAKDDKLFTLIKNLIPENGKNFIKKNIFHIAWLKFQIQDREAIISDHEEDLKLRYKQIGELQDLLLKKGIQFQKGSTDIKKSNNNQSYELTTFSTEDLIVSKFMSAKGTSYIDMDDNNFYLVSATGRFFFTNLDNLNNKNFSMNHIETNIKSFISERFLTFSKAGIKDILVKNDKIFVSYTRELKDDCFITGLLVADINNENLSFDHAYKPNTCVNFENSYGEFNFHHSGGRIFYYNNDEVILTSGEYRFRPKAQEKDNQLGKILLINFNDGSSKIISLGHRNPQGLYYDSDYNIIVSTEHGPMDGDELNIIKNAIGSNKIKNYGWPISSYGEHYGVSSERRKTKKYKIKYEAAPLNKSHKDFGFEEPIKYWVPGIQPSQIVKVSSNFDDLNENQHTYYFGSMGKNLIEGDLSLHKVVFDIDYNKIISEDILPLDERIRDVIYDSNNGRILMFMETSAKIGLLTKSN